MSGAGRRSGIGIHQELAESMVERGQRIDDFGQRGATLRVRDAPLQRGSRVAHTEHQTRERRLLPQALLDCEELIDGSILAVRTAAREDDS